MNVNENPEGGVDEDGEIFGDDDDDD